MEGGFHMPQDQLIMDSPIAPHDYGAEHGDVIWFDDLYAMPVDASGTNEKLVEDENQAMTPARWLSWVLPTVVGTPAPTQDQQDHEREAGLPSSISSLDSTNPIFYASPELAPQNEEAASVSLVGLSSYRFERKPFECNLCRVGFNQHFNMLKHKRLFHGINKIHECSKCGVRFYELESLERHIVKIHERRKQTRHVKTRLADSKTLKANKPMAKACAATVTANGSILSQPGDLHAGEQQHGVDILPELAIMESHDMSLIESSIPSDYGFADAETSLPLLLPLPLLPSLSAVDEYEGIVAAVLSDECMLPYPENQHHPTVPLQYTGDELLQQQQQQQQQCFTGSACEGGDEELDSHNSLVPMISVDAESGQPVPLDNVVLNLNDNRSELESLEEEHRVLNIFAVRGSSNVQGFNKEDQEQENDDDSELEGIHKCDECPKWYVHRRSLLAHRRATGHRGAEHKLERTHACGDCGAAYVHRRSLLSHCRKTGCAPEQAPEQARIETDP